LGQKTQVKCDLDSLQFESIEGFMRSLFEQMDDTTRSKLHGMQVMHGLPTDDEVRTLIRCPS
jgi:hypothetical protein